MPDAVTMKGFDAVRLNVSGSDPLRDILIVEAPLHIQINDLPFTTTMRTPGHDRFLTRGLLHTESIIPATPIDVGFEEFSDPETGFTSRINVIVAPESVQVSLDGRRSLLSTSSCGMCGTRSPADIEIYGNATPLESIEPPNIEDVEEMLSEMRRAQKLFDASGGSHGAALFSKNRTCLTVHEDIGRHNAVDKVVGELVDAGRLGDAYYLTVSGRVSYEIVYKAYYAAVPCILAVSAPSSMAVETAQRLGITLVAFCREKRATVYSNLGTLAKPDAK